MVGRGKVYKSTSVSNSETRQASERGGTARIKATAEQQAPPLAAVKPARHIWRTKGDNKGRGFHFGDSAATAEQHNLAAVIRNLRYQEQK
jgi:ribosomal protein L13E